MKNSKHPMATHAVAGSPLTRWPFFFLPYISGTTSSGEAIMAMPTPTRPMPTMALVYFSRPPIVSTVFLGKCNLPRTPRRRCGCGSGPLRIIPRPLGRGFRSGRGVRVTSASDTRARDASRALVWRPVARLLPCTFSRHS